MKKLTRNLVSVLLILSMLLTMTPMVFAGDTADENTPTVTETTATGGASILEKASRLSDGKQEGDWSAEEWKENFKTNQTATIDSAWELVEFATASSGITFTTDTKVTLNTDIILNEGNAFDWYKNGTTGLTEFPGITYFVGEFNGNGKTVSGVYLLNEGSGNAYDGFFKVLSSGTTNIHDLNIVNSYFTTTTSYYPPSMIGRIADGSKVTVSNCYSNAIVTAEYSGVGGVGGIVSLVSAGATNFPSINGCIFEGYLHGNDDYVGGIIGWVADYNSSKATVSNCANLGTLASGATLGGIVGRANTITVNQCMNYNATATALVGSATTKTENGFTGEVTDNENWGESADGVGLPKTAYANAKAFIDGTIDPGKYTNEGLVQNLFTVKTVNDSKNKATTYINSEDALLGAVAAINNGYATSTKLTLTRDLVFNEGNAEDWLTAEPEFKWTPIENFVGTFNGQGHTVSGVYLKATDNFQGFFGKVNGAATIQNFGITNSCFDGANVAYAPSMVGRAVNGCTLNITNCYSSAIINGGSFCAGGFVSLVSTPKGNTVISGCIFAGKLISTGTYSGGIVGLGQINGAVTGAGITIKDCVNMGIVSGKAAIVPTALNLIMSNCINYDVSIANLVESKNTSINVTGCYAFTDSPAQTVFKTEPEVVNGTDTFTKTTGITRADVIGTDEAVKIKLPTLDFTETETETVKWILRENGFPLPKATYNYFDDEIDALDSAPGMYTGYETQLKYRRAIIADVANDITSIDIDSEDELVAVASLINEGLFADNAKDYTFTLMRDMIFNAGGKASDWATTAPAFTWTPISNFRGTFDGNGCTVSGLYMNSSATCLGLFGSLGQDARVSDVGVVNSYIKNTKTGAEAYVGSVAALINARNVAISGCYSNAIIEAASYAGGIVGYVTDTSDSRDAATAALISECVFDGSVKVTGNHAAGIVGSAIGSAIYANVNITDCVNLGEISNTAASAAGIIGYMEKTGVIVTRCLNYGTTTGNSSGENIWFKQNALVGQLKNANNSAITFKDCFIFSDLSQNLFNSNSQQWCSNCIYVINGVTVTNTQLSATIAKLDSKATIGAAAKTNMPALFGEGSAWTLRDKVVREGSDEVGDYPLPTSVYNNFFKIKLKYVQTTKVNEGKFDVRFTAEIDSLGYEMAGYDIIINLKDGSQLTNADPVVTTKVFSSIKGNGNGLTSVTARDGRYFVAITIKGIDAETIESFTVTPYTLAGKTRRIDGETVALTFSGNTYTGVAAAQ